MEVFESDQTIECIVPTDAELVVRCIQGKRDAFGVLMSRHEASVRRRIRRFGISPTDAEDLEQEVWVRAFRKLGDLHDGASFRGWLMQVAETSCLSHVRRFKRRDEIAPVVNADPVVLESVVSGARDPSEDLAFVTGLLASLPPQYSEVLMLRYLDDLSLEEIAARTGVTVSGAKWRLNHARQIAQEALGDMDVQNVDGNALEQLIHRADDAAQASRWQEAIEAYEMASRRASLDWDSLQTLGRIYERRGDFPRALKLLEQAMRIKPWPWLQVVMGWCYDGLGERDKAVSIYESVLLSGSAGPWVASAAFAGMRTPHSRRRSEPEPVERERAVPRRGWSVKTNHNSDEACHAIDGDAMTRWTSQAAQDHNMYFELDLGREWPVTRVVFDDDGNGQCIWLGDCPHGYLIETSVDRATWAVVREGSASADEYAGASMDGSPVRHIRIRLTQDFYPNWWSIYEIRVYAR